ncbi:hypothetical protein L195_g052612 [Trifolium pratense]|uniref:Uncharacterized protein n=1 Tax=Trifolium pratense TaxID=57577 RepID=A0A2K3K631_TRIPR|nr:hypothetical protein L195_g052612 [Trifolium pratense]
MTILHCGCQVDFEEAESSSHDSEFVEATQLVQVADSGEIQGSIQKTVSKEALHDRQFLNESWANMAENEEEETRLLIALEKAFSIKFHSGYFKVAQERKSQSNKEHKIIGQLWN